MEAQLPSHGGPKPSAESDMYGDFGGWKESAFQVPGLKRDPRSEVWGEGSLIFESLQDVILGEWDTVSPVGRFQGRLGGNGPS